MYIFELASYLVVAILFGIGAGWLIWGDEPFEAAPVGEPVLNDQAVADLSSQVETRDQEIVRLRKRLKRMHADLDSRDLSLTEAKGHAEELQGLLAQRESEMTALMNGEGLPDGAGSELLTRRVSELEELLAASRSEADGLARKLQDSLSVEQPDVSDAHERLAALEADFSATAESHRQLEAAHSELQRSHAAISNDLAEAQARLDEMVSTSELAEHDRIRVLEAEIGRLRDSASAAQQRVAELENEHQATIQSLHDTQARAVGLEQQLADAGQQQSEGGAEIEAELAKVHAELARSRQNVNSLRQRLQDVEDENESLAGDLARATTELQGRSAKTNAAAAERDQLAAARDQLVAERADLARRIEELSAAQQQLVVDRDSIAAEHAGAVARLGEMEQGSTQRHRELEAQVSEAASQRASLAEQLQQARTALAERESALADREQAVTQATADAQAAKTQVEELRRELDRAAMNDAERQRLERANTELAASHEATVAQLQSELGEARLRADSAFEALNELNEEFINFRDMTLRQQTTMNSLADRLARANSTLGSTSSGSPASAAVSGTPAPDDDAAGR